MPPWRQRECGEAWGSVLVGVGVGWGGVGVLIPERVGTRNCWLKRLLYIVHMGEKTGEERGRERGRACDACFICIAFPRAASPFPPWP